jgi:hypothetical protein
MVLQLLLGSAISMHMLILSRTMNFRWIMNAYIFKGRCGLQISLSLWRGKFIENTDGL